MKDCVITTNCIGYIGKKSNGKDLVLVQNISKAKRFTEKDAMAFLKGEWGKKLPLTIEKHQARELNGFYYEVSWWLDENNDRWIEFDSLTDAMAYFNSHYYDKGTSGWSVVKRDLNGMWLDDIAD